MKYIIPFLSHTGAKVVIHSIVDNLVNNTGRAITQKVGDFLRTKIGMSKETFLVFNILVDIFHIIFTFKLEKKISNFKYCLNNKQK